MSTMNWKTHLLGVRGLGGDVGSLFIVAVVAYMMGLLTSPAFPLLATIKTSYLDVKTQFLQPTLTPEVPQYHPSQISLPEQKQQQEQISAKNKSDRKHQPLRGYEMLPSDLVTFHQVCKRDEMPQEKARKFLIDELYDGVSPYEEFPPKNVAPLLQTERIRGWGSEKSVFRRLMEEVKPRVMIELGSFLGASATHLGSIVKELELQTDIFCIDDFRGWPGFRKGPFRDIKQQNGNVMLMYQFMQNVVYKNLTETILPIPFGTVASLSNLCQWGIYADLIEVDASHDFHSAWADINIAYRLLRPGGVMFGHDYFTSADKRGVRRSVDLFARRNNLRVEPDGQHWIYRSPLEA